jgi:hypothetical protein
MIPVLRALEIQVDTEVNFQTGHEEAPKRAG